MTTEDRMKALEEEFRSVKNELRGILYDIRTFVMEAESPIPNDLERERLDDLYAEWDAERKEVVRAQKDSEVDSEE